MAGAADPPAGRRGPGAARDGAQDGQMALTPDSVLPAGTGAQRLARMTEAQHAVNAVPKAPANPAYRARRAETRRWRGPSVAVRGIADGARRPS